MLFTFELHQANEHEVRGGMFVGTLLYILDSLLKQNKAIFSFDYLQLTQKREVSVY